MSKLKTRFFIPFVKIFDLKLRCSVWFLVWGLTSISTTPTNWQRINFLTLQEYCSNRVRTIRPWSNSLLSWTFSLNFFTLLPIMAKLENQRYYYLLLPASSLGPGKIPSNWQSVTCTCIWGGSVVITRWGSTS